MASAASPTQDLVMAALTNCSLKFLQASDMAWYHCSNQTVYFSLSVPKKPGIPGILFRMVGPMAPMQQGWPPDYSDHYEHSEMSQNANHPFCG